MSTYRPIPELLISGLAEPPFSTTRKRKQDAQPSTKPLPWHNPSAPINTGPPSSRGTSFPSPCKSPSSPSSPSPPSLSACPSPALGDPPSALPPSSPPSAAAATASPTTSTSSSSSTTAPQPPPTVPPMTAGSLFASPPSLSTPHTSIGCLVMAEAKHGHLAVFDLFSGAALNLPDMARILRPYALALIDEDPWWAVLGTARHGPWCKMGHGPCRAEKFFFGPYWVRSNF